MNKPAVLSITDELTTAEICRRLGVSSHSVRHARFMGRFPARWFDPLEAMCAEAGIECPRSAFHWISADENDDASG